MRVAIVDPDLKAGRRLAASVEKLAPDADVLLYGQTQDALTGLVAHSPDVTFVAPSVGAVDGPAFLAQVREVTDTPKWVGMVDDPDPDASVRWVEAGAHLVVARPVDALGLRNALRHSAGGLQ